MIKCPATASAFMRTASALSSQESSIYVEHRRLLTDSFRDRLTALYHVPVLLRHPCRHPSVARSHTAVGPFRNLADPFPNCSYPHRIQWARSGRADRPQALSERRYRAAVAFSAGTVGGVHCADRLRAGRQGLMPRDIKQHPRPHRPVGASMNATKSRCLHGMTTLAPGLTVGGRGLDTSVATALLRQSWHPSLPPTLLQLPAAPDVRLSLVLRV